MLHSTDGILTTHAGSLSRTAELIELNGRRASGVVGAPAFEKGLSAAVSHIVERQQMTGIDILNDGEYGKPMAAAYDYGVWWNYAYERMAGFVPAESVPQSEHKKS